MHRAWFSCYFQRRRRWDVLHMTGMNYRWHSLKRELSVYSPQLSHSSLPRVTKLCETSRTQVYDFGTEIKFESMNE